MQTLNGKEIANSILELAAKEVAQLGFQPHLAIVFVGEDAGSEIYVNKKQEAGKRVGVIVEVYRFPENSDAEVKQCLHDLAVDSKVQGIILQLPAPGIEVNQAFDLIPPEKDVDGLNPLSLGLLWQGRNDLIPATAQAVIEALKFIASSQNADLKQWLLGKNVLIINRSLIIGKPLAALFTDLDATVTIAHSKTRDLQSYLLSSDIVVAGAGVPGLIKAEQLKQGAIIIDASFVKTDQGVTGDVGGNDLSAIAGWLSPVPNGIGPLGVACLIANTVKAAKNSQ